MWRSVREMTNNFKQQPPRILKINGIFTTSLRKITNECNNYFVSKFKKLRDKFQPNNRVTSIEILKYLIPRVNQTVIFKKIDRQGVKKLLKQAKATNFHAANICNTTKINLRDTYHRFKAQMFVLKKNKNNILRLKSPIIGVFS